jgi:hypothetical protein
MRLALDWNTAATVDGRKEPKSEPMNDYVKNQKRHQTLQSLRNSLSCFNGIPPLPEISDSPPYRGRKDKPSPTDIKTSRDSVIFDGKPSFRVEQQSDSAKLHAFRSTERQNAILPIFKYRFTDPVFNRHVVLDSTKQIKEQDTSKEPAPVKVWRPELQCVLVSNKKALHNRYYNYEPGF